MTVAYEPRRTSAGVLRRLIVVLPRWVLPFSLVALVAAGLEWARLGLRTPSLVDDWFGITYSPAALRALLSGEYGSSPVDAVGRYRPAYNAVWNYAQWHLFGNPSVSTAAAWGALRAALFLVAIWLLACWVADRSLGANRPLLWLAPLAVAVSPGIALDLVRHGPADPMMVAGLIIGLALLGVGARTLLKPGAAGRKQAVALVAIGYLVYLVGVYSKEASVSLFAFAPFFLKWLGPDFSRRLRESRGDRYLIVGLALLLLSPLIHVGAHLALAIAAGDNPYPNANFSLGTKVLAAGVLPILGAPGPLGTFLWIVGVPAALVVTATAMQSRDRDAWLLTGVLTVGFLMSAFSMARGDSPSRYYIPWVIAVAAVALRALATANVKVQIGAALIVLGIALTGTRGAVADWTRSERSGSTAVEMAKSIVNADCPAYLANFDVERRVAIPRLLRFARATPIAKCSPNSQQAYALTWLSASLPSEFASRCRTGWQALAERERITMYRCGSFAGGAFLDQDAASGSPLLPVVRLHLTKQVSHPKSLFQSVVVPGSS